MTTTGSGSTHTSSSTHTTSSQTASHTTQPASPPTWGTEFPETTGGGVNKPLVIVAVLGLALAIFGVVRSFVAPTPKAAAAAPSGPSYFTEQRQMMHEAMEMAREARAAQREHMEMMRKAMEESETGSPSGE